MSDSFQKEIPKARVNIGLEVEKGEATEKKELPLKMLAVGDFSQGKTQGRVMSRERINVHKDNLDQVLKDFSPTLNMNVPNKVKPDSGELGVSLTFQSYKDFSPEAVARKVPELNKLIAMRNLLKELKSNLIDNVQFRKEVEKIFQDKSSLQTLHSELSALISETH